VVGAGIFGVTAALELNRRGYRVSLVDPGPLPHPQASSTDISKVIRMDYGADEETMALMEQALAGWQGWNERWDEPLFHQVGFLLLSSKPLAPGSFEGDSYELLLSRGHQPERLDAAAIRSQFPQWSQAGFVDGYFNPEAGWAESGRVVARLAGQAEQAGVEMVLGSPIRQLAKEGDRIVGVERDGELLQADWVVLAAGAWSPGLLPELAYKVWPIGQPVIHFRAPDPAAFQPPAFVPWAADIAETGWYGFPALADGTLKMANHGPGRRIGPGSKAQVLPEEEGRFRRFLEWAIPALAQAPRSDARVCYYSDSWDGDFYIDRVPNRPGLVVATGGSGHAFKFAPVLGAMIADALEGVGNPNLTRYRWRQAGSIRTEDARNA
jgi:glycine/D-amino acid oxidase-like deaminating enzyme